MPRLSPSSSQTPRRIAGIALFGATIAFAAICWSRAELIAPQPSVFLVDRNGVFLAQVDAEERAGYGYWPAPETSERVVLEPSWSRPGSGPAHHAAERRRGPPHIGSVLDRHAGRTAAAPGSAHLSQ
jgi:hypothetical protein